MLFSPCPQVALECELELMKGWRVQDECDPVIMARMISHTVDLPSHLKQPLRRENDTPCKHTISQNHVFDV